jgi:GntR family transcriptional regulator/MocR family aminotransferase
MANRRAEVIAFDGGPERSRFRWLYDQLRSAMLEGRLAAGSRVPSTRALAQTYGVARGTVVDVFEQLAAEGYVEARRGSGTFVATSLPDRWFEVRATFGVRRDYKEPASANVSARGRFLAQRGSYVPGPHPRAFQAHRPAIDNASVAAWERIAARRRFDDLAYRAHNDVRGYAPLRAAVAEHLVRIRGVRCHPDQILIFTGVLAALDFATRMIADPGSSALVEDPGYDGARRVFEANGLGVRALPVDEEGADIARADAPDHAGVRVAFVTPSHQYPLGMTMSVGRRLALLSWAKRAGAWIFEDDYDGEYRYAGRPITALQGLDEHQSVIYSGSFNKALFPALRLSYLVIPERAVEAFCNARAAIDRYPGIVAQTILSDFIAEGHFERHVRRMREVYAERLERFLGIGRERLGDRLRFSPVTTGLALVADVQTPQSDAEVARAALERDVEVLALSSLCMREPVRNGLLLGFAGFDEPEVKRGASGLAQAFAATASAPSTT